MEFEICGAQILPKAEGLLLGFSLHDCVVQIRQVSTSELCSTTGGVCQEVALNLGVAIDDCPFY
jgi:hypothetical protein